MSRPDAYRFANRGWPTPPDSSMGFADCLDVMLDVIRRQDDEKRAAQSVEAIGQLYPRRRPRSKGGIGPILVETIRKAGRPLTVQEVIDLSGSCYGAAVKALSNEYKAGRIVRLSRGIYQAAPGGEQHAAVS